MSTRSATRPKAAPSGTAKTVPQGQSSRMAKGREAQAKAATNKAKVEALNAQRDVATNKGERITLARQEEKLLKAWMQKPKTSRGPKPVTPNFDAVKASFATTGKAFSDAKKPKGERTARKLEGDALTNAKKAYELRVNKKASFTEIAEALGYSKASAARRACVSYARQNGLTDPVARRSVKAAERFTTAQGGKFDPKAFTPVVTPTKPKPPTKPKGAVKKATPGQKRREVTPIPKGQPVKKAAPKKALGRKVA